MDRESFGFHPSIISGTMQDWKEEAVTSVLDSVLHLYKKNKQHFPSYLRHCDWFYHFSYLFPASHETVNCELKKGNIAIPLKISDICFLLAAGGSRLDRGEKGDKPQLVACLMPA